MQYKCRSSLCTLTTSVNPSSQPIRICISRILIILTILTVASSKLVHYNLLGVSSYCLKPRLLAFSFICPCSIGCCTAELCNFCTWCSIYCRSAGGVPALEAPLAKSHRCTTPAVEPWSSAMCSPAMPNPSIEQYELEYDPNSNCAQIRFMYVLAVSKASIDAVCSLHQTLPMEVSVRYLLHLKFGGSICPDILG